MEISQISQTLQHDAVTLVFVNVLQQMDLPVPAVPTLLPAAAAGAGLWAGLAIGAGWLLKDAAQATIVTLCACPEDAGYLSVRPLSGGYAAWMIATRGGDTAEET